MTGLAYVLTRHQNVRSYQTGLATTSAFLSLPNISVEPGLDVTQGEWLPFLIQVCLMAIFLYLPLFIHFERLDVHSSFLSDKGMTYPARVKQVKSLLRVKDYGVVVGLVDDLISGAPTESLPDLYCYKAEALFSLDRKAEATDSYISFLKLEPSSDRSWSGLCRLIQCLTACIDTCLGFGEKNHPILDITSQALRDLLHVPKLLGKKRVREVLTKFCDKYLALVEGSNLTNLDSVVEELEDLRSIVETYDVS